MDYGFRAIIAPSFADIFANNCLKNGLLPVVLSEPEVAELVQRAQEVPDYRVTVDLEKRVVQDASGYSASFPIDDFRRYCLMEGLDDIGLTLRYEPQIATYERGRAKWRETHRER
jgi:3-isopropylmalate/(R)-2-methylmalate dehydratase small subunit